MVTSSVSHANWIYNILTKNLEESSVLVTYNMSGAQEIVGNFEKSDIQWIVPVGMVSKGTYRGYKYVVI
jgi:hypothetical protein